MENKHQDHNHGKSTLHLVINGAKYQWHAQYISGAEIRKIASIQ
jgi:hypothetical protein